ncbi:MAG: HD-GYP domain-containing protein, partial [Bryobacteraceae bacterium]
IRQHPYYTRQILVRVEGVRQLCRVAAHHHERLIGTGSYWPDRGAVDSAGSDSRWADAYDALAAQRPYRDALPAEELLAIIEKDSPEALDADCVRALRECLGILPAACSGFSWR